MENTITIKMEGVIENSNKSKGVESETVRSSYARRFDLKNPMWHKDTEFNKMLLGQQQTYANAVLVSKKYLFLNDVYDMLGFPKTKAGQVVGWVYDRDNPIGDNYVDFGIFSEDNADFVNGYENAVWLDFNVDGMILDRI
jgi:hypothetical protein